MSRSFFPASPSSGGQRRDFTRARVQGLHEPGIGDADPIPMLAAAQLWARDIPDLTGPPGFDLLQVFGCPFEERSTAPTRAWTSF
ncbi:hypothetical protein ABZY16_21320 [Streptomyces sp. NPDC006553]|uniref:hypothetical protein n=1 Tax=Streptomyces sp. NPDC006553 TaxID=3157180 RepID=UPI0033A13255